MIKKIKYKNATINIKGKVDQEKLKEATVRFMRNADRCRRRKQKEKNQNDNQNTSGAS